MIKDLPVGTLTIKREHTSPLDGGCCIFYDNEYSCCKLTYGICNYMTCKFYIDEFDIHNFKNMEIVGE